MAKTDNRQDLATVIGPKELRDLPIHRWFVYPHSFGASLVNEILDDIQIPEKACVWDPFVGAGTTMVVCRKRGISGFGSDILPLSTIASRAKTSHYTFNQLKSQIEMLSNTQFLVSLGQEDTNIPFLNKAFSNQVRACAYQIRSIILNRVPIRLKSFFLTALVRSYCLFGSFKRDGGWPRLDSTREPVEDTLLSVFLSNATNMANDVLVESFYFQAKKDAIEIRTSDFHSVKCRKKFDAVITSPPYLNKHDYTRLFAPELSLLGFGENSDLIRLRHRTLCSHVESLNYSSRRDPNVKRILRHIIGQIENEDLDSKRNINLILGYFEDLFDFLRICSVNLKTSGHLCLVISNVQFSGVPIPVDEILVDLAKSTELILEKKWLIRQRGNSSQQMAKYGRHPASEWVLIWKKS